MALLNSLIPSAASDVVAIFPEAPEIDIPDIGGFSIPGVGTIPSLETIPGFIPVQVFQNARPMRAQVSEPSRFMIHPLESGAQVTDHRIIDPVEITITFILEPDSARSTYLALRAAYLLALRLSIQTKATTYTGMYIADLPHDEDPEFFDTFVMVVKFREVQFVQAQIQELASSNVIDPQDASTIPLGERSGQPTNASQDASGSTLFKTFGDLF